MANTDLNSTEGLLLVNKPVGRTSFHLVASLRRILGVKKIGHAGTLDPFADGVMVMLIGRNFTRLSDQFLCDDKEYLTQVHLGISTDTFDLEGQVLQKSDRVPSLEELKQALSYFQGEILQTPPMFSAKKINGQKLYELARKGKVVERQAVKVRVETQLVEYQYPFIMLKIKCSKGTYIRSIADELGQRLECGAHLTRLTRTRSGPFALQDCFDGKLLNSPELDRALLCQKISKNLDMLSK